MCVCVCETCVPFQIPYLSDTPSRFVSHGYSLAILLTNFEPCKTNHISS